MKLSLMIAVVGSACALAGASTIASWDMLGQPGNQAASPGVAAVANVSALSMVRGAGLSANAGANSFNSAGWTQEATDYISFGFSVDAGYSADLTSLIIGARSSNTGPGSMGIYYNGDGFSSPLATLTLLPDNVFTNAIIDLSALTGLTGLVEFRLIQVGNVAANGGTTGASGTFRVADYFDGSNFIDTQFTGSIVPGSASLALLGLGGFAAARRRRN
ncbi:MAG: hypothetical protein KF866_12700 [Phycisphaeraceae bacterium]|nr:hypothetical protein [Phycisphaeraceae bacterium]MCW5754116.1 hypothetical protein [Phycisphaeraceae bacterium]